MNPIACIRYALCLLAAFACFSLGTVAHAQTTFTVNYPGDDSDTNAGDGTCDTGVDPAGPASVGCSLRAALQEANALAGADTIHFSIATLFFSECGSESDGTCTLAPASALPAVSEALYIDGETQPGATCGANFAGRDLRIVLDGSGVANDGLRVEADNSVVRGLVIHSFANHGLDIDASGTRVSCMYIGTDVTGMVDMGNGGDGIVGGPLTGNPGTDIVIGTNSDGVDDNEEWNLISGNGGNGIHSDKPNSVIAGNLIGVNAAISDTLGNGGDGIYIERDGRIGVRGDGVADLAERNVIGGNGGHGIRSEINDGTGGDNYLRGNFIGTDTTATLNLGNALDGFSTNYSGGTVGSNLDDNYDELEANVIAFNGENGIVTIQGPSFPPALKVRSNSIFSNTLLGFDVLDDGADTNDVGDEDSQGSRQNYPELISAVEAAGQLHISYLVDTDTVWLPHHWPLRVEFFGADADQEEGKTYLGFDTYDKTDWHTCGSPPCVANVTLVTELSAGDTLVAMASGTHYTSEFSPAFPVSAPSLVVNTTTDAPDILPGDGICDNGAPVDLVNCSLRAAIEEANALAGPDTIAFLINPTLSPPNFCGSGICGIVPDSALPAITDTVAILGETQPTSVCGTIGGRSLKVVLSGSDAGSGAIGLELVSGASGSRISGLNIQNFDNHGIELDGADGVHIACNNIGTNVYGTVAIANGGNGVNLTAGSNNNTIGMNSDGTDDLFEWNVISGNTGYGVSLFDADNNVVAFNGIGIGADGATAIGNGSIGVRLRGSGNRVGTDGDGYLDAFEGNVITANGSYGVYVFGAGSMNTWLAGNYIGTNPSAVSGLGNTGDGVRFGGEASHGIVGSNLDGTEADIEGDMANVIAFNGGAGVALQDADIGRVAINGNSIFSNVGLGIDLNIDGPTGNDAGDVDVNGANKLQNYPDISAAYQEVDTLTVMYTVDSDPSDSDYPLTVEFFVADADHEEGQLFVARDTFTVANWSTCGSPPCARMATFTTQGVALGDTLVATATDSLGNTSEFSVPVETVEAPPPPEGIALHVKAFLEGPYAAGVMNTDLNDQAYVPLSQPFSHPKYNGTVLNYDSTQTVGALPDSTVDWVIVSLRTGTGPETNVAGSRFAALISENGTVASTGEDSLRFTGIANGSYYLILRARNHVDVMSSSAIDVSSGVASWDFTTGSAQAFGLDPMKNLGGGNWGLYAGDANADGLVTVPDFNIWFPQTTAGVTGYEQGDFDMDGNVTVSDFNKWNPNTTAGAASGVPN